MGNNRWEIVHGIGGWEVVGGKLEMIGERCIASRWYSIGGKVKNMIGG